MHLLRKVSLMAFVSMTIYSLNSQVVAQSFGSSSLFAKLKVGQWVKIDGSPQKDGTVLTEEVKILTGDIQDDDWEVFGRITRIDYKKKQLMIHGLTIRTSKETEYEIGDEKQPSFQMLKRNMPVEVEGTFLKDGTFLADEIQDETYNPKKQKKSHLLSLVGKVQKMDPNKKIVEVMGIQFLISSKTKVKTKMK